MKTGYAIELLFDEQFDKYVRTLWQSCQQSGLSDYMQRIEGDVVPHIALSVYEDIARDDIMPLFERYKNVTEHKAQFESSSICMFKDTKVTYINVNVNRDMLNYFENVYHFFVSIAGKCSPYYLPYVIIPHISIARCDDFDKAKQCLCHVADEFTPQKFLAKSIALFELKFDDNKNLIECRKVDEKTLAD